MDHEFGKVGWDTRWWGFEAGWFVIAVVASTGVQARWAGLHLDNIVRKTRERHQRVMVCALGSRLADQIVREFANRYGLVGRLGGGTNDSEVERFRHQVDGLGVEALVVTRSLISSARHVIAEELVWQADGLVAFVCKGSKGTVKLIDLVAARGKPIKRLEFVP